MLKYLIASFTDFSNSSNVLGRARFANQKSHSTNVSSVSFPKDDLVKTYYEYNFVRPDSR